MESSINKPQPVWIHSSQQMQSITERRRNALFSGRIPNSFLYSGYAQSKLWLEVFRKHSPAIQNPEFQRWHKSFFASFVRNLQTPALHVVGLGSGGGEKDCWLLDALQAQNQTHLLFTPVDVSEILALLSAQRATNNVLEVFPRPLVAELSACSDLESWLDSLDGGRSRVFTCFGVIPNLAPESILPLLRSLLREEDILLLSANLAPVKDGDESVQAYRDACQQILPQYDNAETRRWVSQVLLDWGLSSYLEPVVCQLEPWADLYGVIMISRWRSAVNLVWEECPFQAEAGQELVVFSSLRYTPERLRGWLAKFGLKLGRGTVVDSGEEGIWDVRAMG